MIEETNCMWCWSNDLYEKTIFDDMDGCVWCRVCNHRQKRYRQSEPQTKVNMKKLSTMINSIAAISGTNDKIARLSNLLNDPIHGDAVKDAFTYAYSPRYVYGLKQVEPLVLLEDTGQVLTNDKVMEDFTQLLMRLHRREITGNLARAKVSEFLSTLDEDEQVLACNIIKGDLRCGMNVSIINKASPNLVESAPPYMRCSLMSGSNYENFPKSFYSQIKMDGMFLNLKLSKDEIVALTRNGNEFPIHLFKDAYARLQELVKEHTNYGELNDWFAGELVMMHNGKMLDRKTSNGITNKLMKGGTIDFNEYSFKYYAWDMVWNQVFTKRQKQSIPYEERFTTLQKLVKSFCMPEFELVECKIVNSHEEAMEHYYEARKRGLEGTVIKNPESFWMDGTSPDQIKMKAEVEIDLRVVGMNPGKGKNAATFGSLQMESDCGMVQCNVSGFTDEERKDIFAHFDTKYRGAIATVRSNELITSKKSTIRKLFLPRFIEFRFDKTTTDDLQRIQQIFESVL